MRKKVENPNAHIPNLDDVQAAQIAGFHAAREEAAGIKPHKRGAAKTSTSTSKSNKTQSNKNVSVAKKASSSAKAETATKVKKAK